MSMITSTVLSYLLLYKYPALFVLEYLSALIIHVPIDPLLVAGAFSSQGYFNIYIVFAVTLLANILGDITGFFVVRRYGTSFLKKIRFGKILVSDRYIKLQSFIERNAGLTIFLSRVLGPLGPEVNILCGLSKIPFKRYIIYDVPGEIAYVLIFALLGYFLGNTWQSASSVVEIISIIFLVVVVIYLINKLYFESLENK